ncbi:hypothetical protein [Christensenella timonensis]|uniref:hypothetical protein n=1 Tax=Christensenella timonensis TaxID=1816678 RepID=UPI0008346BCB|nr:hypothetical protein [Christensenella timonensis]
MSSRIKSSEEITAEADELQKKLAGLRKEARKLKKLEEQAEADARRQKDIAYALEFIEFAKRLRFQNGNDSYFDYIARKLAESKATSGNVASVAVPATTLRQGEPSGKGQRP